MIARIDWKTKVVGGEGDKKNYRHFENLYEILCKANLWFGFYINKNWLFGLYLSYSLQ